MVLKSKNNSWKIIFLFFIIFISCSESSDNGRIREGVIEYDISYLENNLDNIATHLLPKKMTLSFNGRYSLTTIDGFMGMFSIGLLSDLKEERETTMVKIFSNKYVHYGKPREQSAIFQYMDITEVKKEKIENTVAKYKTDCMTIVEASKKDTFRVFFTDMIGVHSPNRNNPFSEVDGVMLQFDLQLSQIRMKLVANKVNPKKISNDFFTIPEDYRPISKENMAFLIDKMMEMK